MLIGIVTTITLYHTLRARVVGDNTVLSPTSFLPVIPITSMEVITLPTARIRALAFDSTKAIYCCLSGFK